MRRKIFLSLLLLFTACLALPGAGWAAANVTALQTALTGAGLTVTVRGGDPANADQVLVNGTVTNATNTLALNIPAGVFVGWGAQYTYTGAGNAVEVTGGGHFEIGPNGDGTVGTIVSSSAGGAAIRFNSPGMLYVGGRVESTGGNAVVMDQGSEMMVYSDADIVADTGNAITSTGVPVHISGGTVESASGKAISSNVAANVIWADDSAPGTPAISGALDCDLNVTGEATLNVPAGKTLTVDAGKTLTVAAGGTLTNNGTVNRYGTITIDGTLNGANPISIMTAAVNLTAPVLSANSAAAATTGIGYTVSSTGWADAAGSPLALGEAFAADTVYTATVVLTSGANYKFGDGISDEDITGTNGGTVSGVVIDGGSVSGNLLQFKVTYPATHGEGGGNEEPGDGSGGGNEEPGEAPGNAGSGGGGCAAASFGLLALAILPLTRKHAR